jgi:hypothetical protein
VDIEPGILLLACRRSAAEVRRVAIDFIAKDRTGERVRWERYRDLGEVCGEFAAVLAGVQPWATTPDLVAIEPAGRYRLWRSRPARCGISSLWPIQLAANVGNRFRQRLRSPRVHILQALPDAREHTGLLGVLRLLKQPHGFVDHLILGSIPAALHQATNELFTVLG